MWKVVCKLHGTIQCTVSDDRRGISRSYNQNSGRALRGHSYHALRVGCGINAQTNSLSSLGLFKKKKKKDRARVDRKMSFPKGTGKMFHPQFCELSVEMHTSRSPF